MNKQIKRLFIVFFILASLGLLSACDENGVIRVKSIEINQDTVSGSYEVGTFDLSSVELIVRYNDGSTETIDLDPSMIDSSDLVKLSIAGIHEITVNHLGRTVTFTIELNEADLDTMLDMLLMPLVYDMMDGNLAYGFDETAVDEIVVYGVMMEMNQPTLLDYSTLFTSIFVGGVAIIVNDDQDVSIHHRDLHVVYVWDDLASYDVYSDGPVASMNELDDHICEFMDMFEAGIEYTLMAFPDYKSLVLVNRTLDPSFNQAFAIETVETDNFTYAVSDYYDTARLVGVQGFGVEVDTFVLEDSVQEYPVESVKPGVFNAFDTVRAIVLPSHLTFIGSWMLSGLDLESITIPESVTSIGWRAFDNTPLTSITIEGDEGRFNAQWSDTGLPDELRPGLIEYEGLIFDSYLHEIIDYQGTGTDVVIPGEIGGYAVTRIGYRAFENNQLTSVMIPDSVTSIGDLAFCDNQLTSVTITEGVTDIGSYAFIDNRLASVNIPDTLIIIGDSAFSNNRLTSVIIPGSVKYIGESAFRSNQLTSVTIKGDEGRFNADWTSIGFPEELMP